MKSAIFYVLFLVFSQEIYSKTQSLGEVGLDVNICDAEITSLSGQDTVQAQLTAKYSRDLAISGCSGSHFAPDKECIDSCLKGTKGKVFTVSADCEAQTVTSALGKTYKFKGVKENIGANGWDQGFSRQEWENLATNKIVSEAVHNWHIRSAFEKLCPTAFSKIKSAESKYERPISFGSKSSAPNASNDSGSAFKITRFFKSSSDFYGVVFSVTSPVKVKCVIADSQNTPLAVEIFQLNPPAEEVVMRYTGSDSSSDSVKCYKQN